MTLRAMSAWPYRGELRREVAETRAELDAAQRAADLTLREKRRIEESRSDLKASVTSLERQLSEHKVTLHSSQEAERYGPSNIARHVIRRSFLSRINALELNQRSFLS